MSLFGNLAQIKKNREAQIVEKQLQGAQTIYKVAVKYDVTGAFENTISIRAVDSEDAYNKALDELYEIHDEAEFDGIDITDFNILEEKPYVSNTEIPTLELFPKTSYVSKDQTIRKDQ